MEMKIYDTIEINEDKTGITVDGKSHTAMPGKHEIWIPEIRLKLIWSWNGRITALQHCDLDRPSILNNTFNTTGTWQPSSLQSIADEIGIFTMFSDMEMSPPLGDIVYFRNCISYFPYGEKWCDPLGIYGYNIEHAEKMKPGNFSEDKLKKLLDDKILLGSPAAISDVSNTMRNNLINGYCIDVRRSWRPDLENNNNLSLSTPLIDADELKLKIDVDKLREQLLIYGQFPFERRRENYQEYYLTNIGYISGTRKISYRYGIMGLDSVSFAEKSVVDLGCCTGGMVTEAYMRGARKCTGIDHQKEFIICARDLARYNGHQINYQIMDMMKPETIVNYLNKLYPEGIDICYALALYKHIKENMFKIIDNIKIKTLYVEGHNAGTKGFDADMNKLIETGLAKNWNFERIGMTTDRSPRCLWKATKK